MGVDAQKMEIGTLRHLSVKPTLLLLIPVVAGMATCAGEDSGDFAEGRNKPLPDQVISDFQITMTSMGQKDWSMKAEQAFVYEGRNILEAKDIEVTFFGQAAEVRSVLRADYGRLDRNSDDMEAKGDVVVTGSDGVVLETESLQWKSSARKIVSDDSVRVIRHQDVLTGWGFRGDPDLGSFEILRNMRATIKARQEEGTGGSEDE